jgi:hypothetical protein
MGKKYVITSAQANAKPNTKFLKTLEHYVSAHDAELVVLPMIGNSAREDSIPDNFHPAIKELQMEYGSRKLNRNIEIAQFHVRPYQVDPITGLSRFAQRGRSLVFASPKQRWRHIAHSNTKLPKALITTGALTEPNYATGHDVSAERRRLGNIATRDHEFGAIVVDVLNGNKYHWRNLSAQVNGKFNDLGIEYHGSSQKESRPLAMVCGDWHAGKTDQKVRRATLQMMRDLSPERVVLHDFFDGHSVSHHMAKRIIGEMVREGADIGHLSLEDELRHCGRELQAITRASSGAGVYVVRSNHLEFLDRYLDEMRFAKDPHNARVALKLAVAYMDGLNPVEEGIRQVIGIPDDVTFLDRDQDLKVDGYQLGSHGDKGPGGGRGSIRSKENDYGKSITGHVHKSEKLRNTLTVGTMLPYDTEYIKGSPCAWTHSHAFVYPTGVQMLNIINGKYK